MPDLDLIKQEEQGGARDRRGRYSKGWSGNPAGRPRGCRDQQPDQWIPAFRRESAMMVVSSRACRPAGAQLAVTAPIWLV
jgi:hypothetical protein